MEEKDFKKQINSLTKKYGRAIGSLVELKEKKQIQFDSPQLTFAFGGGFAYDRIHNIRGPESGGKSSLATYIAGQLQKKMPLVPLWPDKIPNPNKSIVVYIDFERTFDEKYANNLGLDTSAEHFIYLRPDCLEDAFSIAEELLKTGNICCVVYDSDAMSPTRNQVADEYGKADFGAGALQMTRSIKKFNILTSNYETPLIIISQERANQSAMAHLPSDTSCFMTKFASSTRGRITQVDRLKNNEEYSGIQIRYRNMKNKTGIPWRDAVMNLYFKGGFNPDEEYIDFLIKFNIVKQAAAWFSSEKYGMPKLNGRKAVQEWLNNHIKEYEEMKKQVNELLAKTTELDKDNVAYDYKADEKEEDRVKEEIAGLAEEEFSSLAEEALNNEKEIEEPPDLNLK